MQPRRGRRSHRILTPLRSCSYRYLEPGVPSIAAQSSVTPRLLALPFCPLGGSRTGRAAFSDRGRFERGSCCRRTAVCASTHLRGRRPRLCGDGRCSGHMTNVSSFEAAGAGRPGPTVGGFLDCGGMTPLFLWRLCRHTRQITSGFLWQSFFVGAADIVGLVKAVSCDRTLNYHL